jgi:hypothetical protein
MNLKYRSLVSVILLTVFTFGLYLIYWFYETKNEINANGGQIPTFWLFIIPFVNLYFLYKYSEAFAKIIKHDDNTLLYFIITACLPFIAIIYIQDSLNKVARKQ